MKIGMMGGWNSDSGASFHTELVGRAWVKMGHKLTVFSFYPYSFHGTNIIGKDENYVNRCFTTHGEKPPALNPVPFLTNDYEIFVAQDHGMFPNDLLGKIFNRIKKKAKTVAVVHDGKLAENPSFYQFDWDAVVSFDNRYIDFLKKGYDPRTVHLIPYPCYPLHKGNKTGKRKKLRLPATKKIIYMFGPAAKKALDTVASINQLGARYPILLLITIKDEEGIKKFRALKQKMKNIRIDVREEAPDMNRLYDYLHASDVMIFGKESAGHAVVSSTVFQCLGSGCVILSRDSNYVEKFKNAVLRYSRMSQLKENLAAIFEQTKKHTNTMTAADKFVEDNSSEIIGRQFIDLFDKLKQQK